MINNLQTNRQLKIPAMGFSDYFIQTVTAAEPHKMESSKKSTDKTTETDGCEERAQKSDQEILESIEGIYFQPESNAQMFELQVRIVEFYVRPLAPLV